MVRTGEFRDGSGNRAAAVLGTAAVILLLGIAGSSARTDCEKNVPADEFSAKVDTLLTGIEGPGFPSDANLDTWHQREEQIRENVAELLELTAGDVSRRRATVQFLIVVESMSASPSDSRRLGSGPETGEVRAWARHVLKGYAAAGVTRDDIRAVDRTFISSLQEAWADHEASHTRRSLPVYQAKATALRDLAMFEQSPQCE
jgi:hypothetical protein